MGQRTWATLLSLSVLLTILLLNVSKKNKEILLVSNFALYDQVKALAPKDKAVAMLIPFGQDAHSFVATPKNIAMVLESKHFFYVSKGMDAWIKNSPHVSSQTHNTDLSPFISWVSSEHDHGSESDASCSHDHNIDPHYWFSISNQLKVSEKIKDELILLYPENKGVIVDRYELYKKELEELEDSYKSKLSNCKNKMLYVTHDAFAYLERDYGFEVSSIVGLNPESSPSASAVNKVIKSLKKSKVQTIFFESFISDKMAMTVARELNLNVDVLETLATITVKQNEANTSYKSLMLSNLSKLSEALSCH